MSLVPRFEEKKNWLYFKEVLHCNAALFSSPFYLGKSVEHSRLDVVRIRSVTAGEVAPEVLLAHVLLTPTVRGGREGVSTSVPKGIHQ